MWFPTMTWQALPIFLDKMFNEWVAVILSVTFVLAFGEVKFLMNCEQLFIMNFEFFWYYVPAARLKTEDFQ